MGLIEERKRAAETAAASTRQAEDASRSAQTAATSRTQAEHSARVNAFQSSAAPEVVRDAVKYLGGRLEGSLDSEGARIIVGDSYNERQARGQSFNGGHNIDFIGTTTKRAVPITGNEDGSVRVGNRTLSASQARNTAEFQAAVEAAYQKPIEETTSRVVASVPRYVPPSNPLTAVRRRLDPNYDDSYSQRKANELSDAAYERKWDEIAQNRGGQGG